MIGLIEWAHQRYRIGIAWDVLEEATSNESPANCARKCRSTYDSRDIHRPFEFTRSYAIYITFISMIISQNIGCFIDDLVQIKSIENAEYSSSSSDTSTAKTPPQVASKSWRKSRARLQCHCSQNNLRARVRSHQLSPGLSSRSTFWCGDSLGTCGDLNQVVATFRALLSLCLYFSRSYWLTITR